MMGALGGFLVGYVLGTKAGKNSVDELRGAMNQIRSSEAFKAFLATGMATASTVLGRVAEQGKGMLGSVVADQAKNLFDRRFLGSAA
jgi:hypothetical protein